MNLTPEQQAAVDKAIQAIKDGKLFRIGGYAGTGKTTIAKYIVEAVPKAMVCAFTGKAANRLHEKGLSIAQTIHRTIYDFDPRTQKFHLKGSSELYGDYFLIDEGSMISKKLWDDITSFEKPIVLLGDPGQLEPIGKDPNLMKDPDVILEKIHRQAAKSGIIRFATDVRLHHFDPAEEYPDVDIVCGRKPTYNEILSADVVICGYNATRCKLNVIFRQKNERRGVLCAGERVICLKNNMNMGIFNGQTFDILQIKQENDRQILAKCGDDGDSRDLVFFKAAFGAKKFRDEDIVKARMRIDEAVVADYGYAITCHKSQGSEWDNVVIIDQQCEVWNPTRWRYTAITRAAKKLRYFML